MTQADTKARKASIERPDAQIEAFNVAGANLVHVRLASDGFQLDASAFGLAVTMVWIECVYRGSMTAINLLHHGEAETAKQMSANRVRIGFSAITGDLNHAGDTLGQVRNKVICIDVIPLARQMRDNQFSSAV